MFFRKGYQQPLFHLCIVKLGHSRQIENPKKEATPKNVTPSIPIKKSNLLLIILLWYFLF